MRSLVLLIASVLVIGSTSCASTSVAPSSPTPSRSPQTATGATPSSVVSWPSPTAAEVKLGAVGDLVVGPGAVYALYTPVGTEGKLAGAINVRVARIDRASGVVRTVGPFPGALRLAVGAGSVWVGGGNHFGAASYPGAVGIVRLDANTLQQLASVSLPPEPAQRALVAAVAASSDLVWLAYGAHLYALNPKSDAIEGKQSISGTAASIAFDAQASRLYVGADASDTQNQATITQWDPSTLTEVASAPTGGASLGGPEVAAAGNDVWVAFATGMLGQVEHRRAPDLTLLASPTGLNTNSVRVYLAGGFVWTTDGMANRLACLDPQTGAVLASTTLNLGGVVAGDRAGLFVGDINGVSSLVPDPRCRQQT